MPRACVGDEAPRETALSEVEGSKPSDARQTPLHSMSQMIARHTSCSPGIGRGRRQ